MKKRYLLSLVTGALLSTYAIAQTDCQKHERVMQEKPAPIARWLDSLELSQAQEQQVEQVLASTDIKPMSQGHRRGFQNGSRQKEWQNRQGGRSHHQRPIWGDLINTADLDEASLQVEIEAKVASTEFEHLRKAKVHQQIWSILNDEQRELLLAKEQARKNQRQERAELEVRAPRWAKRLSLSENQQSQVDNLTAQLAAHRQQVKEHRQSFKNAERALIRSAEFNHEKWALLWEKHKSQAVEDTMTGIKIRHAQFAVLTPEQREAVKQKMRHKAQDRKGQKRGDTRFPG